MMPISFRVLVFFALLLSIPSPSGAQSFQYLDDAAEAGGYDVTATVQNLPVEWRFAEQEDGTGYRVIISSQGAELLVQEKQPRRLAISRKPVKPGRFLWQHHGQTMRVFLDHHLLLEAEDATYEEGKVGYLGGVTEARLQPVEDVVFDDDFMRIAEEVALAAAKNNPKQGVAVSSVEIKETIWQAATGKWSSTGLSENEQAMVAQSANPFVFKSSETGVNLATAGRDFWSDYSYEVSIKPQGARAVGLAAYVQDAKNYLLFRWGANGPLQLRAVVNGQTRVLDEAPGGYEQKQWYRLRLSVLGGLVSAWIDDNEVLRGRTGLFGRGLIGLYAENPTADESADFDDVQVRSLTRRLDDFSKPVPGRWQTVAGKWKMQGSAQPVDKQGSFAVMGQSDWTDYSTIANVTLPADASAGLVLRHETGKGAYLLRVTGSKATWPHAGRAQILKMSGGKTQLLAETPIGSRFDGKTNTWKFSVEGGYLRAAADGSTIVDAYNADLESGRAGLYAQSGPKGVPALSAFQVDFSEPRPTWAKVPDLYEEERQAETMGGWSTPEGLWAPAVPLATAGTFATNPKATANASKMLWHKGAFFGDSSVRLSLPDLKPDQNLNLLFGGAGAATYILTVSVKDGKLSSSLKKAAGKDITPEVMNKAATLKSGEMPVEGAITEHQIEVARRGTFLLVRAGKDEVWSSLLAARVFSR